MMMPLAGLGRGVPWNTRKRSKFSLSSGLSVSPGKNAIPSPSPQSRTVFPSRGLGQGVPSEDRLSEEAALRIQELALVALDSLQTAFLRLSEQYQIAVDQGTFRQIPIIGQTFTQREVLTQMILVAGEMAGLALEIGRAGEPYLGDDELATIDFIHQSAQALIGSIPPSMQEPILQEHLVVSKEHIDSFLASPLAMKGDMNRAIVEAEAKGVPVPEPIPKKMILAGIGAAALVVIAIVALSE